MHKVTIKAIDVDGEMMEVDHGADANKLMF
jgi:hypothetical protein